MAEAALSFLGLGLPITQPSLGTLIRSGYDLIFAGIWWVTVIPGLALIGVLLSVNLLGDALRDALDPRLARSLARRRRKWPKTNLGHFCPVLSTLGHFCPRMSA
jgi:hypothetical protein